MGPEPPSFMSDGPNCLGEREIAEYHVIALRGDHIALHTMGLRDPIKQNVQTNVIALGEAHISLSMHGLLISATTRVHRSTGLDKH